MAKLFTQQNEAFLWAKDFIENKNIVEATLTGSAGTGKTFLLKHLINNISGTYCITAPVHKALRVLEETVNSKTFHSLHGLRPNIDLASFDISNPQFDPLADPHAKNFKLIICDEASQINRSLYQLNLDRAKKYGYKILYIGDNCQLPPVSKSKYDYENESMVFKVSYKFELTEIVRQEKGNPLLEPFQLLRDDIKNKTKNFTDYIFKHRDTIKDNVGYKLVNNISFMPICKEIYTSQQFKSNPNFSRHICYTNDAVAYWNEQVRRMIFPDTTKMLEEGDILMAYNTVVDNFNDPVFVNSETYRVEHLRDYTNDYGIKVFAVNLVNNDTSLPTKTLQIVDHNDLSYLRYYEILSQLHLNAKKANTSDRSRMWKRYFDFKNEILSLKTVTLPTINNKAVVKKDFDYGYAITAHKAQGSTFDIATIDLHDMLYYTDNHGKIKRYPNNDLVNKLIYVGITRVRNKAYIVL